MDEKTGTDEQRFPVEDILFSRTDTRGVIQSGNEPFLRISAYARDEIVGAPHKVVRHHDMPRGVFHMIWSSIQAGDPMGGYVQNMAQDGVPYWVFATILPVEGGYVSVRLKPTHGHLEKIIPIYAALRAREDKGELTPEQSAGELNAAVQDMDYSDYEEFMTFALRDEVAARDSLLKRPANAIRNMLVAMFKDIRNLERQAGSVEDTFHQTHQIPYNMRLQAGRLEGSDGPISVISGNHRQMTQSLEENLNRFSRDSTVGADAIQIALFKSSVVQMIEDLTVAYEAESDDTAEGKGRDLNVLFGLAETYRDQSLHDVRAISDRVRRFARQCRDMRRMMSGLELTRIMCKIERSKFDGEHAGLDEIVNRLADAQTKLGDNFDGILSSVSEILSSSDAIQRTAQVESRSEVA